MIIDGYLPSRYPAHTKEAEGNESACFWRGKTEGIERDDVIFLCAIAQSLVIRSTWARAGYNLPSAYQYIRLLILK